MLTRRQVLTGTAASSIAAIASAHGVAAAPAGALEGFPADLCAVGSLEGGALGAFHKERYGFGAFIKWDGRAAEVFYKEQLNGGVQVFFKFFNKGWSPVGGVFLKDIRSLENAEAAFLKITPAAAEFFIKGENSAGYPVHVYTSLNANGGFEVNEEQQNPDLT